MLGENMETFDSNKEHVRNPDVGFGAEGLMPFDEIAAARLAIPQQDIPVCAVVNGLKVQIGVAHIDPDTKIVTTKLNEDHPYTKIWLENHHRTLESQHHLAGIVQVSELTLIVEVGTRGDNVEVENSQPVCRECAEGRHDNCDKTAWNFDKDESDSCYCTNKRHIVI
jgi:hypothetical protein